MDFDEPIVFPMNNVGVQEGIQLYNSAGGIFLLSSVSQEDVAVDL